MLPIDFQPDAHLDIVQTILRYEQQQPGLGFRFEADLEKMLSRIQRAPHIGALVMPNIRRRQLLAFRYFVLYRVYDDRLLILGVLHNSQHPQVIKDRISLNGNGAV